ncbi:MAG: DUF2834 domain-containing protein [Gemmataceae bacterium]
MWNDQTTIMTSTVRQIIYGLIALVGMAVTWYCNLQYMAENDGFSVVEFVRAAYVNYASASIGNDVLVATVTFLFWSFLEARRLKMSNWWIYFVLTFGVAVAFSFPVFLLMRERQLAANERSLATQDDDVR